jgi:Tol biopolymer transport system component
MFQPQRRVAAIVGAGITITLAMIVPASATPPGDNGQIAYRRIVNPSQGTSPIFAVRADGTAGRQLTHPGARVEDTQPDWSADGRLIVFQRCAPDTVCASYTVRPDGTQPTRLSPPCDVPPADIDQCTEEDDPAFMPDSRRVVVARFTGPARVLSDGQEWIEHSDLVIRDLHTGQINVVLRSAPFGGDNKQPVAAPDGSRLAFQHQNSPLSDPAGATAVFVVGVDGRHLHRITPWELDAGDHPDWSPDGQWILFRSNESGAFLNSQLYLVHPDGSDLHPVTDLSADTLLLSASFSPDGQRIVYAQTGLAGQPDIFTMAMDGTDRRQVTDNPKWDSAPDWGPELDDGRATA